MSAWTPWIMEVPPILRNEAPARLVVVPSTGHVDWRLLPAPYPLAGAPLRAWCAPVPRGRACQRPCPSDAHETRRSFGDVRPPDGPALTPSRPLRYCPAAMRRAYFFFYD